MNLNTTISPSCQQTHPPKKKKKKKKKNWPKWKQASLKEITHTHTNKTNKHKHTNKQTNAHSLPSDIGKPNKKKKKNLTTIGWV
jgi:hypothetical protein